MKYERGRPDIHFTLHNSYFIFSHVGNAEHSFHTSYYILHTSHTSRWFWIAMTLSAVVYLPSLSWGLGLDQNIFAEIGSLILKGKKPYLDAWDVKPPNIFYTYAIFEWLFGQNSFAVRMSDYVTSIMAIAAIFFATRRLNPKSESAPALASIMLSLTLLSLGLADTAQTESYSLMLIIIAGGLVVSTMRMENLAANRSVLRVILAGALIGIAAFFKTTNAIFLMPIILEVFLMQKRQSIRPIVFLLLGFISCCMIEFEIMLEQGNLTEYLRIAVSVLSNHTSEASSFSLSDIPRAIWIYVDIWSIIAIAAIAIAIAKRDGEFLRSIRFSVLLLIVGIVSVILQNKGWGYQYVVLLPGLIPIVALSAIYLFRVVQGQQSTLRNWLAISGVLLVFFATLFITPSARRRIHYVSSSMISIRDHPAYIASIGSLQSLYYPAGTEKLASYIESHSSWNNNIFILGEEPGAYWLSNRSPASKYIYSLLFTSGVITAKDLLAMSDSLAAKRPRLIIVERFDTLNFRGRPETSESLVASDPDFAPMKQMLARDYIAADTVCDKFIVYRRR